MVAPNTAPIFELTPKVGAAIATTADTSTGPTLTHPNTLFGPAPTQGSRLDGFQLIAQGAVTATMARLFLYDGTNYRFWWNVPIQATAAPSGTQIAWEYEANQLIMPLKLPFIVPGLWSVVFTLNDTQAAGVLGLGFGGDY